MRATLHHQPLLRRTAIYTSSTSWIRRPCRGAEHVRRSRHRSLEVEKVDGAEGRKGAGGDERGEGDGRATEATIEVNGRPTMASKEAARAGEADGDGGGQRRRRGRRRRTATEEAEKAATTSDTDGDGGGQGGEVGGGIGGRYPHLRCEPKMRTNANRIKHPIPKLPLITYLPFKIKGLD
uniref:Uncharacterized protein n=1 Tax=Oryza nivara TaxID=4536 RepID=A0A0E0IIY3_ORYNI